MEERIFKVDELDCTLLFPLLAVGADEMNTKLTAYAKNQLPGGKYWKPEPAIEAILKQLKPNNDLCENGLIQSFKLEKSAPS